MCASTTRCLSRSVVRQVSDQLPDVNARQFFGVVASNMAVVTQ